jgi:hypothetical protein
MAIRLKTPAVEQSTYIVIIAFLDSTGKPTVPKLFEWTLMDEGGEIVNHRESVNVDTPESTESLVLSGADLALPDPTKPTRHLLLHAQYDSVEYGNDLPCRQELKFTITDLFCL